jgi:hypothetical protein
MQQYTDFIQKKALSFAPSGIDVDYADINSKLFQFQKDLVKIALKVGKFCIWANTGLGKTGMMLSWSETLINKGKAKRVLILAPLGVAKQTVGEGAKFEIKVTYVAENEEIIDGICVTNYDRLHKFDCSQFDAVVLDESSILKDSNSSTRNQIIDYFKHTPYKLACSATPSPNDYMELGNQCEFLGVMSMTEMLSMFFTHDGGETSKWRLKGHSKKDFWKFVCSWAVMVKMPSDLGYSDDGYILPELNYHTHQVTTHIPPEDGQLMFMDSAGLNGQRHIRKTSMHDRCQIAVDLVKTSHEQWLIWCETNEESALLSQLIPEGVEVKGADSSKHKEESMAKFSTGEIRILITKPKIAGMGMNWQNCHNVIYIGLSHCYSEDTEVLSWRGWLKFSEVTTDDLVATVNPSTLCWEWQQPSEVIWSRYDGDMIHFKSKGCDLLVTPNHNMFAQINPERYKTNTEWGLKEASDIRDNYKRMRYRMRNTSETFVGKSIEFVDIPQLPNRRKPRVKTFDKIPAEDLMLLAGWYISEGYCCDLSGSHAGQITIAQTDKKMENRLEIIDLIQRIGLKPNIKTKDIAFYSIQLATFLVENFGRHSQNIRIPFWVKELDATLLTVLRDTILKGDGCHSKKGEKARFLRTSSRQLADDFQEICLKTGIRASINKRTGVNKDYPNNVVYDVQLAWQQTIPALCNEPITTPYSGFVGCLTVPNHTLIVRRNGIPIVSGNSFEAFYQSVRRVWRFGQQNEVHVHIIQHQLEGAISSNLRRKEKESQVMAEQMVLQMQQTSLQLLKGVQRISVEYKPDIPMVVPKWLKTEVLAS